MKEFEKRIAALSPARQKLLKIRLQQEGLDIDTGLLPGQAYKSPPITAAEKKEYYPLSSVQSRLLTLDRLEGTGTTYHVSSIKQFNTALERKNVQDVFKALIARHESLRTSFTFIEGEPVQQVHQQVEFEIKYFLAAEDAEKASPSQPPVATILENLIRPFDLAEAPLLHVGLVKLEEEKYLLIIDMHHIMSDALSEGILWNEYESLSRGQQLTPLYIQYRDFSQWQNSAAVKAALEQQEMYWLNEYTGEIPIINLPTDYERPANKSVEGAYRYFKTDKKASQELKALAIQEKTTLFAVMLSIYNVFLAKICRQEDIVVGIPVAGRRHAGLDKVIGMFVNTLALRNYPGNDKSFIDLLKHVRQRALEAFENQDYPFEQLVNKVVKKRDSSRNPVFDVFFGFKAPGISSEMPKVLLEDDDSTLQFDDETPPEGPLMSMFDLYFYGAEIKEEFYFGFTYSTKLFKKETIARFSNYIKEIISTVAANKRIKLKDIKISHHLAMASSTVFQDNESDFDF